MKYYSNEIVFRGHPDKVCDQISDAILDAFLKQDPDSRVAVEVCGGKNIVFITGEITSKAYIKIKEVAKRVLREVGYEKEGEKEKYKIIIDIRKQSPDIALGTNNEAGGAGDNGMMFGYACRETDKLLPKAMVILQEFAKKYDLLRQQDERFKSDGKAQITGIYDDNNHLVRIKTATICYQNTEENRAETDEIIKTIFNEICEHYEVEVEQFLINPTGKFKLGGFDADAGLTGRKIVVDSYQSFANVGGGAFSGKDPSKVDRSGAYKAREIAVKILKEHPEVEWAEVQLSYAIGKKQPLAIYINTNIGHLKEIEELYKECEPLNIIKELKLKEPQYEERAKFGHFS